LEQTQVSGKRLKPTFCNLIPPSPSILRGSRVACPVDECGIVKISPGQI